MGQAAQVYNIIMVRMAWVRPWKPLLYYIDLGQTMQIIIA